MIKSEQIPDEVVEAAAADLHGQWNGCKEIDRAAYRAAARAAIIAALAAWPGAKTGPNIYHCMDAILHLPLPTETRDGE